MQAVTAGPGVAQRQLAVSLASRAAAAAPAEDDVHQRGLVDAVLLDRAHADLDVHAHTAARRDQAHGQVELVCHAVKRLPLAAQAARAAEARVEALRRVHEAVEQAGSPLSRHDTCEIELMSTGFGRKESFVSVGMRTTARKI